MMKFKSTWILIVLLVVIASYYFLVEERRRGAGERQRKTQKEILPYGREDVYRFILLNPRGGRIEVENTSSGWMIISPALTPADSATIAAFIMQLVPGHRIDYFPDVATLDDYGLETPFATVIFFAGGREHPDTIHVGDKTPTSTSCYVRLGASDTVVIAREMTHNIMNKSLYYLREKRFVEFSASQIDSFRVVGGNNDLHLAKRGGSWWMSDPPARANARVVEDYLNNLTRALIRGFPSEDKSELGRFDLENPVERITLHRGASQTEIAFGALDEDLVYVVRTGLAPVVQLEQKLLKAFQWTREELRARNLSFFETGDIGRIRYETPDTTIVLEKHPDGWRMEDQQAFRGNVEAFLRQLNRMQFDTILDESDASDLAGPFSLRITLLDETGTLIDRIALFNPNGPREEGASLSSNCRGRIESGRTADLRLLIEGH